jgi:neutral trehalase
MGFATFDIDRALTELECLVQGQWADGMIPHIVFHAPADSYFPGPDVWGTHHSIATSGITQPPVFAIALAQIARKAPATFNAQIEHLMRAAESYHRWFHAARDPNATGLVATLHNWETGRDNSPEWDEPFAHVPETTVTQIRRKDTGHVDQSMRPSDQDYRRYIHLVDAYRAAHWKPEAMWAIAPFKVADIGTNSILLAAEEALAGLAEQRPGVLDTAEIKTRAERLRQGLTSLWSDELDWFVSRDLITGAPIKVRTSAGLLPLLSNVASPAQCGAMMQRLQSHLDNVVVGIASTLPGEPKFESRRYWRGPVWAIMNWLIVQGCDVSGETAMAAQLRKATLRLIEQHGFGEYFDPLTGESLGGDRFSWTAAILLLLSSD